MLREQENQLSMLVNSENARIQELEAEINEKEVIIKAKINEIVDLDTKMEEKIEENERVVNKLQENQGNERNSW